MESRMVDVEGTPVHVGVAGSGPDVVVLTGGPGCVQYLERNRTWSESSPSARGPVR